VNVLIDTSAWIEHLKGTTELVRDVLLNEGTHILVHTLVIAELVLGGVKADSDIISLIKTQTTVKEATNAEVLTFILSNNIHNKGVGYVDCSLLSSCKLDDAAILTFDKSLLELAIELGVETQPKVGNRQW